MKLSATVYCSRSVEDPDGIRRPWMWIYSRTRKNDSLTSGPEAPLDQTGCSMCKCVQQTSIVVRAAGSTGTCTFVRVFPSRVATVWHTLPSTGKNPNQTAVRTISKILSCFILRNIVEIKRITVERHKWLCVFVLPFKEWLVYVDPLLDSYVHRETCQHFSYIPSPSLPPPPHFSFIRWDTNREGIL